MVTVFGLSIKSTCKAEMKHRLYSLILTDVCVSVGERQDYTKTCCIISERLCTFYCVIITCGLNYKEKENFTSILIVNRKMYTFILKFGLDLFTFINSFGFCLHFNRPSWWFSSSELQCNCSSEWFSILQRKQITFNADVTMHCIAYCTGSTKHKTFFLCQGSLHLI
jgi:hypothetical protein